MAKKTEKKEGKNLGNTLKQDYDEMIEQEQKEKEIKTLLNELLKDSITIFNVIKKPKGERVSPRIYVSEAYMSPKGMLKYKQKYKIIFIPIKEILFSEMELNKFNKYRDEKYPGIKLLEYEDTCPECRTELTLIEKISTNPQVPTHRIAFCSKCKQYYDCIHPGL